MSKTEMNPEIAYSWLVSNPPTSEEEWQHWKTVAESVYVYCTLPSYIKLNAQQGNVLLTLHNQYNKISAFTNHLKTFNDGIKNG